MAEFPTYGKIENLYKCKKILEESITIQEKIHGTNARLMYDEDTQTIRCGGRNHEIEGPGSKYDGFGFWEYIRKLPDLDLLTKYPGYVFHGEFFGSSIQKGITYTSDRRKEFRVFDIRDPDGNFLPLDEVEKICSYVKLPTIPLLGIGRYTAEELEEFLNKESTIARLNGIRDPNNVSEGIVIKPSIPKKNKYGEWMRAKLKSKRWKENASKPKTPRQLDPAQIAIEENADTFAIEVVTEGRIATVAEHITRDGNTKVDMSRTPDFLKELSTDIWKENQELKDRLDKKDLKVYNKAISFLGARLWKKFVERNYNE